MGKRKQKIVVDQKEAEGKKGYGRMPSAPPGFAFGDKSKYTRKKKHKNLPK